MRGSWASRGMNSGEHKASQEGRAGFVAKGLDHRTTKVGKHLQHHQDLQHQVQLLMADVVRKACLFLLKLRI